MFKLLNRILNFFWPKSSLRENLPQPPCRADAYAPSSPTIANNPPEEMVTKEEILMGRIAESDLPADLQANLDKLIVAINGLLKDLNWTAKPSVSSGYRSSQQNAAAGGAKRSLHMQCKAVDLLDDKNQTLAKTCKSNPDLLRKHGLFLENPEHTVGKHTNWAHLDISDRPDRPSRMFNP